MVGRNDPCPCGSGKEYRMCCEKVVAFRLAEQGRESRDRQLKSKLLEDLFQWFHRYWKVEEQDRWVNRFKQLLHLTEDRPIPKNFTSSFHYWLLFDAPCMESKRAVELWMSTIRKTSEKERLLKSLVFSPFTCYEILDRREDRMVFRSLSNGNHYEVRKGDSIPKEDLVFTRLIRLGNRYELFGPYTSFVHEMRGEILVQLEKYNFHEEEPQELTPRETGWKVLGWSIQRAKELENMEQFVSSPSDMLENLFSSTSEPKADQPGLPVKMIQQLEQFYISEVLPLQKGTQAFYSRSLDIFFEYLSYRFGQSFKWPLLTDEVLAHFFSIWYLDHNKTTPIAAKIHLNICKHLFRWLVQEGMAQVYEEYKKVYTLLIRSLPMTIEARKWIMENGVYDQAEEELQESNKSLFILAATSSGPVLLVGEKWRSLQLRSFPTIWTGNRFLIRGRVVQNESLCRLTEVENVYPVISLEESRRQESRVLGQK